MLEFEGDFGLLFKMHGNRSNLILFQGSTPLKLFKNNLKNDFQLSLARLDRLLGQSYENFKKHHGDYAVLYPTFGKIVKSYLNDRGFQELSLDKRWHLIQNVLRELENGKIHICRDQGVLHLSLVIVGEILESYDDPFDAINHFFIYKTQLEAFEKEKNTALNALGQKLQKARKYIITGSQKLEGLKTKISYSQIADILMANLHLIPSGIDRVQLENFYNKGKLLNIKLNKNLTPQKNAENYYRKSKNQHKELEILRKNIASKQELELELLEQVKSVKRSENLKELRKVIKLETEMTKKEVYKPYSEVEFLGYTIQIGKNAKSNDTMLRNFSQKNDLWLHAKGVSGSHVIVRELPGKPFPKTLIEKAAELAAFHSKNRNETLCPVIYTPRKYVRKRKGDPAGAVLVHREQVILVKPSK